MTIEYKWIGIGDSGSNYWLPNRSTDFIILRGELIDNPNINDILINYVQIRGEPLGSYGKRQLVYWIPRTCVFPYTEDKWKTCEMLHAKKVTLKQRVSNINNQIMEIVKVPFYPYKAPKNLLPENLYYEALKEYPDEIVVDGDVHYLKNKEATREARVGNIIITCMTKEGRDLLDKLCVEYKNFHKKEAVDSKESAYSTLYWAVRYSGLIQERK